MFPQRRSLWRLFLAGFPVALLESHIPQNYIRTLQTANPPMESLSGSAAAQRFEGIPRPNKGHGPGMQIFRKRL
jgi:hypothetical protein